MAFLRFYRFIFISLILSILILPACSKKVVKPSDESIKAKRGISELTAMKEAYEAKDISGVTSRVSSDYKPGFAELQASLRKDFESFDRISLDLKPDRVEIEDDRVKVASHWFGRWLDKSGSEREGRGSAVFIFRDTGASFQLVDAVGDSPFGLSR